MTLIEESTQFRAKFLEVCHFLLKKFNFQFDGQLNEEKYHTQSQLAATFELRN